MNKSTVNFLRSVALSRPAYAFGETGDVAPSDVTTDYPSPPVFSVNELLPSLKKERAKATTVAFGLGVGVAVIGGVLYVLVTQNDRLARRRYRAAKANS